MVIRVFTLVRVFCCRESRGFSSLIFGFLRGSESKVGGEGCGYRRWRVQGGVRV